MNNSRIPDGAVEAAKAAYAESLDDMRAALEAAAQHMTCAHDNKGEE